MERRDARNGTHDRTTGRRARHATRIRSREATSVVSWRRLRADKLSLAALIVLFGIIALSVTAPAINDAFCIRTRTVDGSPSGSSPHSQSICSARMTSGGMNWRVCLWRGGSRSVSAFSRWRSRSRLGVALGIIAAYYGKFVDDSVNALVQIINNIPTLFLLIMLAVVFRPGVFGLPSLSV